MARGAVRPGGEGGSVLRGGVDRPGREGAPPPRLRNGRPERGRPEPAGDAVSARLDEQDVHLGRGRRARRGGNLPYDAPLSTYLPDYPNRAFAEKATLHQLLTHTSGLGDFFGPEFEAKKASIRALEDYLPLFANKPPLFEPGKGWSYSNAGMLLAGLVVERVSGQDYFAFVRERVYRPAG